MVFRVFQSPPSQRISRAVMKTRIVFAAVVLFASLTAVHGQSIGTILWEFDVGAGVLDPPTIGLDGTIYVGGGQTGSNKFYAINPNGTRKWEYDAPNATYSVIGDDGTVYVTSQVPSNRRFLALNPEGTKQWEWNQYPLDNWATSAIGAGGMIYTASANTLTARDRDGGAHWQFWINKLQNPVALLGHPTIAADGTIVVTSSTPDTRVFAFSPGGARKWEFSTGRQRVESGYGTAILGEVWSPPAIGADGTIFVGAHLAQAGIDSASPIFFGIRPDGTERWKISLPGIPGGAPAIAADGTIYLWVGDSTLRNRLLALNPNGSLKWEYPLAGRPMYQTSPALTEDGMICVGTAEGKLVVLNADGVKKREYIMEGLISSPVIGPDGTIYVGSWLGSSDRGKLYALKGTSGPAKAPWPMFRKNPQQTGCIDETLTSRPVLLFPQVSAPGRLDVSLVGERRTAYRLESSSDLVNWERVVVVTTTNSAASVSLPDSAFKQRFYRAVAE